MSCLLSVKNVGKAYRTYRSELHRIAKWFGMTVAPKEEHWVLRNVNFEIHAGQAVGIVGENGAGKSTLLKIITGTSQASEGKVQLNARVASILELGMGFSPALTGRQNATHTAGMMGFSAEQIKTMMPEIEAFAEVGEYFDEPVRSYSSGMQMRVAFAVATALRPDILIVDEALSVGDASFQHKCFARIRKFQEQGTSLLLVSHDKSAILSLCDYAILLEKGLMIKEGKPEAVLDYYNALIAVKSKNDIVQTQDNGRIKTESGTGEAKIIEVLLFNHQGETVTSVNVGEPVQLRIRVKVFSPLKTLVLGYSIKDRIGNTIFGTNTWYTDQIIYDAKSGQECLYTVKFPADFGAGHYSVQAALVDTNTHLSENYDWQDTALVFEVVNKDKSFFIGCVWQKAIIEIKENIS